MKDLNDQQRLAVLSDSSSVLINAGPGTGKTKTLVSRIVYLIESGVPPKDILALTFTNKAAREMQERVGDLLPRTKPSPRVTTFHGFCVEFLSHTPGEKPAIIPEIERLQLIRNLRKSLNIKGLSTKDLSLHISLVKSLSRTQTSDKQIATLLQKYQESLKERNELDFDDLLMQTLDLLRSHPEKRPAYQHVLVDEFQDTNPIQYELLQLLGKSASLFVIGDPLQSIYGFRGASSAIFDQFARDYPKAQVINLATNYRSAPQIVTLSRDLFPNSHQLEAARKENGRIRCVEVLNEYSEARWIISEIESAIGGSTMLSGHDYQDSQDNACSFANFAVLYRTHRTAIALRRLLDESGLPYQVAGEASPYEQPEVAKIIKALEETVDHNQPLSQLMARTASELGLDVASPDIRSLMNTALRFEEQGVQAFLNHIQDIAGQDFYDPAADAITLLTIHAAKGLEFDQVFLIGAEEGILPHVRPSKETNLDEEKRLFYVAATRASNNLDILHTQKRAGESAKLSQFVKTLPEKLLPRVKDPQIADQQIKIQKRALKRSQTSLF